MRLIDLPGVLSRILQARPGEAVPPPSVTRLMETLTISPVPTPGSDLRSDSLPPTLVGRRRSSTGHSEDTASSSGGETAGRFLLEQELGRGGMGRVVLARDPELLRDVAIKLLLHRDELPPEVLRRFVAEAQITAQLDHPNIVPVHELGVTTDGRLYFVMKKVDGLSLRQVLDLVAAGDPEQSAIWNTFRLLMAFGLVCGAVGFAHERGVLHRDLKPPNIMLGAFGQVLVMDWGIARLVGDSSEEEAIQTSGSGSGRNQGTQDGHAIGTPGYMSPEQARGELHALDERSDVWSLGAILYELITRKRAYTGHSSMSVLMNSLGGPPVDPRERAPELDIDSQIAEICLRAMAPSPDDRFGSTMELAQAVGLYLESRRGDGPECDEP